MTGAYISGLLMRPVRLPSTRALAEWFRGFAGAVCLPWCGLARLPAYEAEPDTLRTPPRWSDLVTSSLCPGPDLDIDVEYDEVGRAWQASPEIPPPPSFPRIWYQKPPGPNYWAFLCLALTMALAWSWLK